MVLPTELLRYCPLEFLLILRGREPGTKGAAVTWGAGRKWDVFST